MGKTKATFGDLCQIQPKLRDLLRQAQQAPAGDDFCANEFYYGYGHFKRQGGLKKRIIELVGWEACTNHNLLLSSEAYDIVVDTIWNALPACGKNCGCL